MREYKLLRQDISKGSRMIKCMNQTPFMTLGSELLVFDCHEGTVKELISFTREKKIAKIHIFASSTRKEELQEIAAVITACKQLEISLYYPDSSVCQELILQGVPTRWYNFFVNLWDEILIEGYEKSLEYMFYEEKSMVPIWGVEIEMQNNFLIYYSPWNCTNIIARGTWYDSIYCRISSEKEYETICISQQQNPEIYQRVHIIRDTKELTQQQIESDHFTIVERFNKE